MEIIDNFLDEIEFKNIQQFMMGEKCPWFYNQHTTDLKDAKHLYYFTHIFLVGTVMSEFFPLWKPVIHKLECKALMRVKGNLYPRHPKVISHNFHEDFPFKHKGCLFFMNSNNGPTVIEKKSILPKENRAVLFDPSLPHRSSLCSDQQTRVTINFNYF